MQSSIKKLPKSQVLLTIELTEEEIAIYQKQACEKISQHVNTPGFRKGKAPYAVLVEKFGKDLIEAETRELAIQKAFVKAATEHDIHPITRPEVKVAQENPLTVEITLGVLPEVSIEGYEKIKIPKAEAKIEEKEIKEVLDHLQKRSAIFTDVDRPSKKGDRVEIEMSGTDEGGAELDQVKSKNHPVLIGDNMFIPGFEDNLIGLKKDEEKEFDLVFPKDYHDKSFQSKKVHFKVKINRIEERTLPEWNEELIEKVSQKKQSLDEFKAEIQKDMLAAKENEEAEKRKDKYMEKLIESTKVEIPPQLIEEETAAIIDDLKKNVESRGITWEKYLEMTKENEEKLTKSKKEEAEKRLKLRFALREVFAKEKFTCTDLEVDNEIEKISQNYPADQHAEIKQFYKKGGQGRDQLASQILMNKLFAKVLAE